MTFNTKKYAIQKLINKKIKERENMNNEKYYWEKEDCTLIPVHELKEE